MTCQIPCDLKQCLFPKFLSVAISNNIFKVRMYETAKDLNMNYNGFPPKIYHLKRFRKMIIFTEI